MQQYIDLIRHVIRNGHEKQDRTGVGTVSVFGYQCRFDLLKGFPLVTLKKTHFKSVLSELGWFMSGDTNVKSLHERGCTIWDEWADENGDLGPIYGKQWRAWQGANGEAHDQIAALYETLRSDPDSRRMIVSAWNVADLKDMALAPCHFAYQFYTRAATASEVLQWESRKLYTGSDLELGPNPRVLSCQVFQRSADVGLGVPFNWASYALLTEAIAAECGMIAGELVWTGGDCHIYNNHLEALLNMVEERTPYPLPDLLITQVEGGLHVEPFGYRHHPSIKLEVAV